MIKMCLKSGQSLVELLVAIAIAALILPATLTGLVTSRQGRVQAGQRLLATAYLKEAIEAVRSVRETGWSSVSTNGVYHPVIYGSVWTLSSGVESITGGFTRSITISDAYRNANGTIVTSGGIMDPSMKTVILSVSWNSLFPSSVDTTLYLARFDSINHTESTVSDFAPGVFTNTVTTNIGDGEVTLGLGPGGGNDWCSPSASIKTTLDLPGQGVTTAISAIPGHAYTTTGGNASGDALDSLTITDPAQPATPSAIVANNYNVNKAYAIYGTTSNLFIGSDHPGLTVIILDPNSLAQVGFFNASGGERPGNSIYTSGNTGYVVAGSKLYAFDISAINGTKSQTELWNASFSGTGKRVMIVGGYAYVASDSTTAQLDIVNLSTHAVKAFNTGNGLSGVDLFVDAGGNNVFLATTTATGKKDIFIIDVTDKTLPSITASVSTGSMNPTGIVAVPSLKGQANDRVIVVGTGGNVYQVYKIDNLSSPQNCGNLSSTNFPGVSSIHSISSVQEDDGDVFSYILTDNANAEFQAIQGGPGIVYSSTGTFESQTFDATHQVAFNRFDATAVIPTNTSIKYQAAASLPVSGSCSGASFSYIGPDGTNASYFATGSALPFSSGPVFVNPSQCFRYKAFFSTSDPKTRPYLYDFTLNYSP